MEITRESIRNKLGFDPLDPPNLNSDPFEVDDKTPSIWAPLSDREKAYVLKLRNGIDVPEELIND